MTIHPIKKGLARSVLFLLDVAITYSGDESNGCELIAMIDSVKNVLRIISQ
jgi:hypothetical protein